jgi:hypothetical protein
VTHRNAVVHGDGVELLRHAAGYLDLSGDELAHVFHVHVTRNELREGVRHAMIGLFPKSSSVMPVARQSARVPAILRPLVDSSER